MQLNQPASSHELFFTPCSAEPLLWVCDACASCVHAGSSSASGAGRKLMQQMSGEPEPLMKWLVDKHNELRYRHGVQLLTWDWSLAWNAYNYIVGCPNGHSGQQGIGENLAWGHQDFNHAMRDWYDEVGAWLGGQQVLRCRWCLGTRAKEALVSDGITPSCSSVQSGAAAASTRAIETA